jgi:diaminopimelate decarboxylase
MTGLDCHIGSQLTELGPFVEASGKMRELLDRLLAQGLRIDHLDLGGGLGIRYSGENPPAIADYVDRLCAGIGPGIRIVIEPGRSLVGNAGVLLSRIEYLKHAPHRNFAIVDAAMNDLMRPALYDAYHEILPVQRGKEGEAETYQVVGPVCETGDFLGHDRRLALAEGDLLAIMSAGAYGMSMSSNYNTRPRAAEVMIDGERFHVIRERETMEQLMAGETIPQWFSEPVREDTAAPATTEKA